MKTISRNEKHDGTETFTIILFLLLIVTSIFFATPSPVMAQSVAGNQSNSTEAPAAEQPWPQKIKSSVPTDKYNRGTPRSSLKGYLKAARGGDFERASKYLDFRYLPESIDANQASQWARRLKIALDRVLWFDLDVVSADPDGFSDDGLPVDRDRIGQVKTPEKTVDILMQRVSRRDGVLIWKISNQTVAEIPHLYEYHGYGPFEESLSKIFPDAEFLGWQIWQWALWLLNLVITLLLAIVITLACKPIGGTHRHPHAAPD